GRVAEVGAQLAVGERLARRLGEAAARGHRASSAARISAMWTARTPVLPRRRAPPICIRQEESVAVQTSAPLPSTARTLSASIAAETSAVLTPEVPPKPQQLSASSSSISSIPPTLRRR